MILFKLSIDFLNSNDAKPVVIPSGKFEIDRIIKFKLINEMNDQENISFFQVNYFIIIRTFLKNMHLYKMSKNQ